MRPDLLDSIPGGVLLAALLRLLVADERREEFVGDLVEEARRELAEGTPAQLAWWLWGQTLRSVPALVTLRVRHLASPRVQTAVLAGPRGGHRAWPLSVAVSLGAHLVVGTVVLSWAFSHVDEIAPIRIPVVFSTPAVPPPPAVLPAPPPPLVPEETRRPRPRRAVAPRPPDPAPAPVEPGPAMVVHKPDPCAPGCGGEPAVRVPPRVAEKRCLSCPSPHLPPVFQQIGLEQDLLVKSCVDARGAVTSVDVLRGLDPLVDTGVKKTVQGWRFSPHTVDGHPVPFCYMTRFTFAMR